MRSTVRWVFALTVAVLLGLGVGWVCTLTAPHEIPADYQLPTLGMPNE